MDISTFITSKFCAFTMHTNKDITHTLFNEGLNQEPSENLENQQIQFPVPICQPEDQTPLEDDSSFLLCENMLNSEINFIEKALELDVEQVIDPILLNTCTDIFPSPTTVTTTFQMCATTDSTSNETGYSSESNNIEVSTKELPILHGSEVVNLLEGLEESSQLAIEDIANFKWDIPKEESSIEEDPNQLLSPDDKQNIPPRLKKPGNIKIIEDIIRPGWPILIAGSDDKPQPDLQSDKQTISGVALKQRPLINFQTKKHIDVRPYKCNLCGKKFKHPKSLEKHKESHTSIPSHDCGLCGKKFTKSLDLREHIKMHVDVEFYKCGMCDKTFKNDKDLNEHIKAHAGVRPYTCGICDKGFPNNYSLKKHLCTHTGAQQYKCDICEKKFSAKANLDIHKRIHGERPFKCEICNKTFIRKEHLEGHTMMHNNVQLYECHICDKKYTYKQSLKAHIKTHYGVKAYKCNVCQDTFAYHSILKKHMMTHTERLPYKCNLCGERFAVKNDLSAHSRSHNAVHSTTKVVVLKPMPKDS